MAGSTVHSFQQDLKYGARLLRTNPSFAAVAILSLALGIGANTAIFQLLDAVRMRTLPVKDPQELAFVQITNRTWSTGSFHGWYSWVTNPIWEQIRDRQQGFSSMFAFGGERLNLAKGGEARYANTVFVSGDMFNTLGVPPLLGRVFTPADDQRGCGSPGAVISYGFWQREFGGNAGAVGRTLTVEGHPFEIVGVTPASFYGVEVGRVWDVMIPLCSEPLVYGEYSHLLKKHNYWVGVMGRLKPGWDLKRATAQLEAISPSLFGAVIPEVYDAEAAKKFVKYKLGALPAANGTSALRRAYESPLWLLLGIAGLVLLIACANLANLILARASAREREIAVRLALGASRSRLIRQLLSESLLLALGGAMCGAVMAQLVSRLLVRYISTTGRTIDMDLGMDWRLLGFTAGLAMLTCVLFGLAPALRSTRVSPASAMNAGARGNTASRERFGVRRLLVVSQIAMSLVLVAGALLFVRTLRNLLTLDAGFQQTGILVVDVDFSKFEVAKDQRNLYKQQILDRMRAVPGVESAALVDNVPVSGNSWNQNVLVAGKRVGDSLLNRVSPGYFRTMGTPMIAGRDFDERDTATSPPVAIVDQEFAKKYFGGDAIGKTFQLDNYAGEARPMFQIVGVVKNSKYQDLREADHQIAYFAQMQNAHPDQFTDVMIRSTTPFSSLTGSVKQAFTDINPMIAIDFHVFQTQIMDGLLRERLMATLSGFFGILAGILATVGLYGVISYMVARRTSEIGIRMALGATPANVLTLVMREAAILLAVGLTIGVVLTAVAARTTKALLFGLKPYDPVTLALAIGALALVAVAASLVPARRASALEPMQALREE